MIELIVQFRKELEEDKNHLKNHNNFPKEMKDLAKFQLDRMEKMVEVAELQNEILHVMGMVITNCENIIDKKPQAVKEILQDAIKRIKQMKNSIFNN
jgi:hypothetical protein